MIFKVFVLKDKNIMFGNADAKALLCFIFIKNSKKLDTCLLAHELEHVKQFWNIFKLDFTYFNLCKAETAAYKAQYKCMQCNLDKFVKRIKEYCPLKTDEEIVKELLRP